MRLDHDAELLLVVRPVTALRRALLRLAGAPTLLGALAEEHPILLLELGLKRFDLDLQGDAIVALRGE